MLIRSKQKEAFSNLMLKAYVRIKAEDVKLVLRSKQMSNLMLKACVKIKTEGSFSNLILKACVKIKTGA